MRISRKCIETSEKRKLCRLFVKCKYDVNGNCTYPGTGCWSNDEVVRLTRDREFLSTLASNACLLCDKSGDDDPECDASNCQVSKMWDVLDKRDSPDPVTAESSESGVNCPACGRDLTDIIKRVLEIAREKTFRVLDELSEKAKDSPTPHLIPIPDRPGFVINQEKCCIEPDPRLSNVIKQQARVEAPDSDMQTREGFDDPREHDEKPAPDSENKEDDNDG